MAKLTKTTLLQILVALSLASASLSHDCSANCYKCTYGGCTQCYRRKLLSTSGATTCSSQPLQPSDHCLIYGDDGCNQCKPGYSLSIYHRKSNPCIPGVIQNCLNEVSAFGRHTCISCAFGYPSKDSSRCIPSSQFKNAIPFCTVGSTAAYGVLTCEKCVSGYTSVKNVCVRTTPNLRGCEKSSEGGCGVCDVKDGYFQRDVETCSRD